MTVEKRRLVLLVAVLVVLAVLSFWPSGKAGSAARPAAPGRREARRTSAAPADPADIPPLVLAEHREGEGRVERNVFRFHDTPTPTPTRVVPTATPLPAVGSDRFIGPRLPTPVPTNTPIIPPAIPYKATGIFGPKERPIVVFEDGNRLINAREGDVLDGRFKVRKINRESVDFAFVGLPEEITRRIPVARP